MNIRISTARHPSFTKIKINFTLKLAVGQTGKINKPQRNANCWAWARRCRFRAECPGPMHALRAALPPAGRDVRPELGPSRPSSADSGAALEQSPQTGSQSPTSGAASGASLPPRHEAATNDRRVGGARGGAPTRTRPQNANQEAEQSPISGVARRRAGLVKAVEARQQVPDRLGSGAFAAKLIIYGQSNFIDRMPAPAAPAPARWLLSGE